MPFVCPEISCNLQWRNATRQLAYAKQGEYNSRKIAVQLYNGANRFTFTPGTYTGEFAYRRPDGAGRAYSTIDDAAAVELDGTTGTAVITLEPEVLGVAGIVECELRMKTSGSLLATFTFGYYVEQTVVDSSTPSPSPDPGPTPTPTGEKTKFFGFETMTAYTQFVAQNPGVLVDGDIVVIRSVNGSDVVHTFYVLVGTQLTSRHVITVGSSSGGASSLPALGGGYGVCSSLKTTVAKIVRIDGFVRTQNVPFQVKFNYDVQSGDTLNVRSSSSSSSGTGACTLRWNGDNVPVGLIIAGCTATLVYDGTYYQVLSVDPVTAPMIADGAITAEKVAAGVIPGWYYYASTSAYNTDAPNVPNGSYVLIGTSQIILYRKASGSLSQICAWPTGGGGTIDLAPNGIGYAVSTTQGGTVTKTATLTDYVMRVNGLVAVKFNTPVEAGATLNINNTYDVPIYHRNQAIAAGVISYGNTALFVFDGTNYNLLCVDSASKNYGTANAGKPVVVGSDGTPEAGDWKGATPAIGSGDEGKVLTVVSGQAAWEPNGVDPEDITEAVEGWLEENIDNPSNPPLDKSLSVEGAAADAAATGAAINASFYQSAKMKLIEILRVAAYSVSGAPQMIDELEAELFPEGEVVSIEAVYTQDGAVVYADTPLDALRADLVVTATLTDESTKVITDYTLTGTLAAGTSTVTVHYRDLTDTFSVTVTAAPTEVSITALYTQGSTVVTPFTPISSLKNDLVVMVNYSNTTSRQLDPTEYTLSGTLTEGTSTVDVAYHGFTDEFTVTVGPAPTVPASFDTDGLICCIDGKQINDNLWYNLVTGVPFVLHNVTVETDGVTFSGSADSYGESTEVFGSALTIEVVYKAAADSGNYAFFGTHQNSNGALCLMHSKSSGKIFSAYNNASKTVHVTPVVQVGMLSATRGDSNSPAQIAVLNGTTVSSTANDYTTYPSGGIEGSKIGTHGFSSMMFKGEILMVCIYNKRKTAAEMQANQAVYDAYYNMGILSQS